MTADSFLVLDDEPTTCTKSVRVYNPSDFCPKDYLPEALYQHADSVRHLVHSIHYNRFMNRSPLDAEGRPGTWKKYHGGRFEEAGLGGHDTAVVSCGRGDVFQPHVTYVPRWDRFVMIFGCLVGEEYVRGKAEASGFYAATSQDGIRWSEPRRIVTELTVFKDGKPTVQHPTLLVSEVTKDTLTGRLLYAYTPRWPTPHHLVARPVTIRLRSR